MKLEISQSQDLPRMAEIINAAYRGPIGTTGLENEAGLLSGPRIDHSTLSGIAAKEDTLLLVMKDRGHALGSVALQNLGSGAWYLSMLAVDPSNQSEGLGKKILMNAEALALAHGAEAVELSAIAQRTTLIEWYERRGYVRTGRTDPFPYDDPSVGTPLRDDLALVVMRKLLATAECN